MKLYVYRISECEYGAGIGLEQCQKLGSIVEEWPLNTKAQAAFLKGHGSAYLGASEKVSRMADLVYELMKLDPTYKPPIDKQSFLERIKSWFYGRLQTAHSLARRLSRSSLR